MLKVHLGVKNGDMPLDVTEQNRCRIAQGSWRFRMPLRTPGYEGLLPLAFRENLLATLMAIEAHFTPTGPTMSSGCSGATYAAQLARQHQKAAPVPPAHACGLRYERSIAGWCAEAAGAHAHSLCLYRGLKTMHASAQHSSGMPRPDRPVGLQVRPLETPVTGLHRRPATSTCGGHNSTSRGRTVLVVDRAPLPVMRAS